MKKSLVDTQLHVRDAIQAMQAIPDRSREMAVALTHLETAQLWLFKSTIALRKAAEESKPSQPQPSIEIQDPCLIEPIVSMPWWEKLFFGCY